MIDDWYGHNELPVIPLWHYRMPADPATLDQFRYFNALCEIMQELAMETDVIPHNATRFEAQFQIELAETKIAGEDAGAIEALREIAKERVDERCSNGCCHHK